ncbi:Sfi1-domain-containing protein [Venturia nashicola]|nr:Sfi1-domain-containing protein [Venturia nashicola]
MSRINGNRLDEVLSDADINLLYDIVLLAAQKPDPPFGPGLFGAYDEIIQRENVPPEESGKYFQFVVRMVSGKREGETVYARFETMLKEMGIEVSPEEGPDGATTDYTEEKGRVNGNAYANGYNNGANGKYEETTQETKDGVQFPVQPITNGTNSALLQPPRRRNGIPDRRSRSQDTLSTPLLQLTDPRGRLKNRASYDNVPFRHKRAASTSTNHSLRIARGEPVLVNGGDAYSADESELSITRSRRHSFMSGVNPAQDAYIFLPPGLFQRSDEEMEEDVAAFQHSKACIMQRRLLWQWRHKAVDLQRQHMRMDIMAEDFDQGILLRNALDQWRVKTIERQQEREISLYFRHEEARAVEMRDKMLKVKALTHWMVVAGEKREKTHTARRQIFRARYFTAWKAITVAREALVRRHVLSKFFRIWQRRKEKLENNKLRAVARYEVNVQKKLWLRLAFQCRAEKVLKFKARQRKEKYFQLWREKVRLIQERDQHVVQMREHAIQRRLLEALAMNQQKLANMDADAVAFRKKKLLDRSLDNWRVAARLQPLAAQVVQRNSTRLLHTALCVWKKNAHMSRQATIVHDSRITRTAFTNWNDTLRTRYLEIRIVARLRAESFYKWIFFTRETIATRERNVKIASSCLGQWAAKAQVRRQALENASQTFAARQRQIQLRGALNSLVSTFRYRQQQEADAAAFRNRRIEYKTLASLRIQNANIQEMNGKAAAARFYILTTSTLRNLKTATYHHQQSRRREIYAQVRRRTKMNLAREMLRRMQNRLAQIRAMEHIAAEKKEDRVMRIAISDFGAWKTKASVFVERNRQAVAMDRNHLLAKALRKLRERHAQLQDMKRDAVGFSNDWAAVEAITSLRRLRFRLLQLRQQDQGARDLREMHWQKHVKNMLRYWAARSLALQQGRLKRADIHQRGDSPEDEEDFDDGNEDDAPFAPGTTTRGRTRKGEARQPGDLTIYETSAWNLGNLDLDLNSFPNGDGDGGGEDEAEDLIGDIDFATDGIYTSTPLPGYLRTPSKRHTARAKGRERFISTLPPPKNPSKPPQTKPPHPPKSPPHHPLSTNHQEPKAQKIQSQISNTN